MSEIKQIYRRLVQRYAEAYPRGEPLWVLNKHIEAYTDMWKAKEPAIVDLALREGINTPAVKELIDEGKTRKEAILEVSKNMRLQVAEAEVKEWLKELIDERPIKEAAERKAEQQIQQYEKSIERLTSLFSKGEISEESYKVAVKKIETDMENLRSEKDVSVSVTSKAALPKPKTAIGRYTYTKPPRLWYLAPFFFGIIGGLIGYVGVKADDEGMAKSLLLFGILVTIVDFLIAWFSMLALLRL